MENNGYAKLVSWEVINFMSIERGFCEFDENNMINLKGYNDSGKSAMLRALEVLFFNIRPNAQMNFIKDGADYFRVVANFADGVIIMRDKYSNGQSLYEMYKGKDLLYSTKVKGVLSKVSGVPEPIEQYLGLVSYNGTLLNSRSCFEKQLLVQTTGGDNYKMLNSVLKSEELATAGILLNNDKNKLASDIADVDRSLRTFKELLAEQGDFNKAMIDDLTSADDRINAASDKQSVLRKASELDSSIKDIVIYEELPILDKDNKVGVLSELLDTSSQIQSIVVQNEVPVLSMDRYDLLAMLKSTEDSLESLSVVPEVPNLDTSRFADLTKILELYKGFEDIQDYGTVDSISTQKLQDILEIQYLRNNIDGISEELEHVDTDIASVHKELASFKDVGGFIQCPNCGELIEVN